MHYMTSLNIIAPWVAAALGKREKERLAKTISTAADTHQPADSNINTGSSKSPSEQFARLTELADMLLNSGELDVYSRTKEQLERWAALVLPRASVLEDNTAGGNDMFAGEGVGGFSG